MTPQETISLLNRMKSTLATNQPSVAALNAVQNEWMELDSKSPNAAAVCARMDAVNNAGYISLTRDQSAANIILKNQPVYMGRNVPLPEALEMARKLRVRTDVAWCASGEWIAL